MHISLIFLAGGRGSRMKETLPKQYLPLGKKLVMRHSLDLFLRTPDISSYVIVAKDAYHHLFPKNFSFIFAEPGKRRQDSVASGVEKIPQKTTHVLIHDSARPFLHPAHLKKLLATGKTVEAAALAVPVTSTIRKAPSLFTKGLLPREDLWKMQTPQMLRLDLVKKGLAIANRQKTTVTDDIALAELAGVTARIIPGSEDNIKITTPFDYTLSKFYASERGL